MNEISNPAGYTYSDQQAAHTHQYLWAPALRILDTAGKDKIFELGCGNGAFAFELARRGFVVTGVDSSEDGIQFANQRKQKLASCNTPQLQLGSANDNLLSQYGQSQL